MGMLVGFRVREASMCPDSEGWSLLGIRWVSLGTEFFEAASLEALR